jgi:putative N6-adenine-specific DNA methylase
MEALKNIGLRPSRKVALYNGQLECRYMKYSMYAGTKKLHKLEGKNQILPIDINTEEE